MRRIIQSGFAILILLIISCCNTGDTPEREVVSVGEEVTGRPYSPAIKVGNTLYVSGQVAIDPATGKIVEGGITEQTRQALLNLQAIIEEAGFSLKDVVKCSVLMDTISFYGPMNEVYLTFFPVDPPARKAYSVESLPLGALVEIDAIAVK